MKILLVLAACLLAALTSAFAQDDTIRVEFVDGATKTIFAAANMPVAKLPDNFTPGIVLDIKGQKWVVLAAQPPAKSDFVQSGKLILLLAKAKNAPAATSLSTLFSMPTVSGGIGNVTGSTPPGDNIFSIHEDDWRQVEFVSLGSEKDIDAEFADIHDVRVNDSKPGGFTDLHVRERITDPVSNLTLKNVRELIPQVKAFDGVGFLHQRGTVPHSFAWAIDDGLIIWGVTDDNGNVIQLCLAGAPRKEDISAISEALTKFTLRYDLYLVDWCKETRVRGDVRDFEKYFSGQEN